MTTAGTTAQGLSPASHQKQLYRAVIASTIGTTIEWYDFFLYSTVTGLAFAKLYFPHSEPLAGTLEAFGIYAVGFAARPVGAAIFGHYGDRMGRKAALIATLMLMGIATFLVAFVPTYDQIGIWGAVILTVLRFAQGVGVGGEWGGSVLLSMEWARTNSRRGLIASWPQFGVPAGLFLANLAVLSFSAISGEQFLVWGWRAPFLISIVLVGVGLYIRLGILETPAFTRLVAENKVVRAPALEVIKRQPAEIILSAFARMGEQAPFYIFTAFIFTYGTTVLGSSRDFILIAVLSVGSLVFYDPLFGLSLGPHRPQAHVYAWCSNDRCIWLYLFRDAQHSCSGLDLSRHRAVAHSARHDVRSSGGAHCRELHKPASL
jgi:MFS family permease